MALVAGVNIPDNKRVEIALRRVHGVGPTRSKEIVARLGIEGNPRISELTDQDMSRIREVIDREYTVEGDLRREVNLNIRRLIDIGSYRGLRHRHNLPVRGQQTRTNARTRRGARKTVAGRRRTFAKK